MKSERLLVVLGFVIVSLIWGSTWLGIKLGLESIPPLFGVAMRFTLAFLVLLVIVMVRRSSVPRDRSAILLYISLALFSFSLPYALVYWGEQYIPSGLASILFTIYPFVVAGLSHFFLPAEKITAYKLAGIILGFIGILVIFHADIRPGEGDLKGMAAIVGSTVLQATALVIVKRMGRHVDPVTMNFAGMGVGLIVMYTLAFAFEDPGQIRFDANGIISILYLGSFGTVVTFVIFYWLLKRVQAVYLSLMTLVTPVLAVILGALWLHETMAPSVFSGAILVFMGILVANSRDLVRRFRSG